MNNFKAVYYRDSDGREPVYDFIESLDQATHGVVDSQIDRLNLLNDRVPHLPFPHSSQVERVSYASCAATNGRHHYRILYRRSERLLVLLHAFPKRSAKIPEGEIAIARQRWDDFKARMAAEPRVPHRAAGHDARSGCGVS